MSAERFVIDVRHALGRLLAAGAISADTSAISRLMNLSGRARGLGLSDLALCLDDLARDLQRQRPLAAEDRARIAGRIVRIHDRVQALDSALAIASMEDAFDEAAGSHAAGLPPS
jgi:hypothetical protein